MALFVGRLPPDVRMRELEDLFLKYGRITRCDIKRGGYGFVEYEDPRDAEDAVRGCDGMRFLGERIVVEWARGAKKTGSEECFKCGKTGHWARDCALGGSGSSRDRDQDRGHGRDDHRRSYDRARSRERSPSRFVVPRPLTSGRSASPRRRSPATGADVKSPRRRYVCGQSAASV